MAAGNDAVRLKIAADDASPEQIALIEGRVKRHMSSREPVLAKILVEQLDVHAYHGWHAHEGQFGQSFLIDMEFEADISSAAETDELSHAIDYGQVVAETRKLFVERRYKLLEAAANGLADDLLRTFPTMLSIFVRVRKVKPPIPERLHAVGVELRKVRNASHG